MKTRINALVERADKWWVASFNIGGREYGTEARHLDEVKDMVLDAAALMTGQPQESFDVALTVDHQELSQSIEQYKTASQAAQKAQLEASNASRSAVKLMRDKGLSLRDVASLLGISVQRASQLAA